MVSLICPMNSSEFKEWFHYNVKCPHYEGLARIKRAWSGVNVHSIYRPSLSLKNRVIALLTGLFLLLIPLFNLLVWKGWETFGKPEILAPPYAPRNGSVEIKVEELAPVIQESVEDLALPEPLAPTPVADAPPLFIEEFIGTEVTGEETIQANWKLEHYPNHIHITRDSPKDRSEATYDKHWNLHDLKYHEKNLDPEKDDPKIPGHAHAKLKDRILHVEGKKRGEEEAVQEKDFILGDDHPWIQQPTWGFKTFAADPKKTHIEFHAINPKDFTLIRCTAKKTGMEGDLLRMTASPNWLSLLVKGTLWFTKKGKGEISQMNTRFFATITETKLVQNNP